MLVNVHSERVNALSVSEGCGIMVCIILHIFENMLCHEFLPNNLTNLLLDMWPKIIHFKTSQISIFMMSRIYFDIFFATQL